MKRITMKCPGACGKTYTVTVTDEQFETQSWVCPKCKFTAPFKVIHQWNTMTNSLLAGTLGEAQPQPPAPPVPPATSRVGNGQETAVAEGPSTKVFVPNESDKTKVAHQMVWQVANGGARIAIPLKPGKLIVGRNSTDSPAQIKVAPDIYMSRQHAVLTIMQQGVKMIASIAPNKPNNPVYVNQRMLRMNESAVLNANDTIIMGKTKITVTQ